MMTSGATLIQNNEALREWTANIRTQFPILNEHVHNKKLVYLDNAATTQKPESVLSAMDGYYRHLNSNIHRGVHFLSEQATEAYEGVREKVRSFIHASTTKEIVFVRGTTEAIISWPTASGARL
jgi:cysteine desulfurase/selenocysteine lyase